MKYYDEKENNDKVLSWTLACTAILFTTLVILAIIFGQGCQLRNIELEERQTQAAIEMAAADMWHGATSAPYTPKGAK